MKSIYQEQQRAKSIDLINKSSIFNGGKAGQKFMGVDRDFVLFKEQNNFFQPITQDVLDYFSKNKISWWGGHRPTGHVLSSQIACLNHLFSIRDDKNAVLEIVKTISSDFVDVFKIDTDKFASAYIQFETVSDSDYLNEKQSTRGSNCTSIDAFIYALHKDNSKWLIPIEWKYTEYYNNQNKAIEGAKKDPKNCKGNERQRRYTDLINDSTQLKNTDHTCYYFEPFYQLMRQTLWAEQMIKNKNNETVKTDKYIHVHVVPDKNIDLLQKRYKCSKKGMEDTWRAHLKDQSKYLIISPEKLLGNIDKNKHKSLIEYLSTRYWND